MEKYWDLPRWQSSVVLGALPPQSVWQCHTGLDLVALMEIEEAYRRRIDCSLVVAKRLVGRNRRGNKTLGLGEWMRLLRSNFPGQVSLTQRELGSTFLLWVFAFGAAASGSMFLGLEQ